MSRNLKLLLNFLAHPINVVAYMRIQETNDFESSGLHKVGPNLIILDSVITKM